MLNLLLQLDNFNDNNAYFYEQLQNTTIPAQLVMYRRLNYLHPNFTLNNIIIPLTFENIVVEHYYDKFKYKFASTPYNQSLICKLNAIELNLLKKAFNGVDCRNKKMQLNLSEQLKMGYIKVASPNNKTSLSVLLKIIGVWENTTDYGLNFKVSFALAQNN